MVILKACGSSGCGMFHINVALNMETDFSGGQKQVLRLMKFNGTPIILISAAGFAVMVSSHDSFNKCYGCTPVHSSSL